MTMAAIDYSIKDLEKVVKLEGKINNVDVSRLTAPGENYVSLVLRADFKVENNGSSSTISLVAKRLPLTLKKGEFNFHGSAMKNEIKWYSKVLPLLEDFARENEIEMDFYPKYYGSRNSLNPSEQGADSDSVLLLENLNPLGYQNEDRYVGFDLNTSKAVLKTLAIFHALPIAIKVKRPETFKILMDFLSKGPRKDKPAGPDGKKEPNGPPSESMIVYDVLFEELAKIPILVPYISKVKSLHQQQQMTPGSFNKATKEPWNTIVHNDFWVNNVMTTEAQEPLVKVVDFQMYYFGSYAKDLVFFLLTSVRNDVTKESMDDLIRIYYDEFTSVLQKTHTGLELEYEDFLEEIRIAAVESEIMHALEFTPIIFGEKGTGVDAAVEEFQPEIHMVATLRNMNQYHKEKVVLMITEAAKRNWIG